MTTKKHTLLLGAHMSVAGGLEQAIVRGQSIGCTAIQLFTKSNRQWAAKKLTPEQIDVFRKTAKESTVLDIVAHASYLINIGSADPLMNKKSIDAVIDELERCHALGIPYLVLHPGSRGEESEESCLKRIAHSINHIMNTFSGTTKLLIETMAGQGSSVCYTFEQIAQVLEQVTHKTHVGVCLDTCHVFVAGYDLRTEATYHAMWQKFDETIGLHNLKAIHINDSKKGLGSHVDRHEDIGKGCLGLKPFELLFNDPKLFDIPKVLETPKAELHEDLRNMNTIRGLISEKTARLLNYEQVIE